MKETLGTDWNDEVMKIKKEPEGKMSVNLVK